jgi:CRP-like cAMP-binding protein
MFETQLKEVPFFSTLSKRELSTVAQQIDEIDVAPGRVLARQGDLGHEFFVILDGTADVTRGDTRLAELGPGDFFGEIGLLEKTFRTATVEATSSMKLITLTGWDMARVEKVMPEAIEQLHRAIEERRPHDD